MEMTGKEKNIFPYGARIREERGRRGVTQEYFAALGGVTVQTQRSYESGRSAPHAAYLDAIANAVDIQYIVTGERTARKQSTRSIIAAQQNDGYPVEAETETELLLSPDEAALLDNYRRSPPEGKAAIKATSAALAQSGGIKKGRQAS